MIFKYQKQKIYYEKYGTGEKNILILPGWGNTRETFQGIINNLKNNYIIYILDYPGFGKSNIPKKELTIYDYADLIKQFIEKKEINNPIIIAHSFGGRITSILSGKYNLPINKIILIDVAGIKRRKNLFKIIKQLTYKILKKITYLLPKKKQKIIKQKLLDKFSSKDYKALPSSMKKTFQNIVLEDLKKYYQNIKEETLIIWGEKDTDTPLKDGILLEKVIKNSALIVYKNASHFSYLDYSYETNLIIESFIKEKDN